MRRLTLAVTFVAFVATVWLANWMIKHYGPIRVWPTQLYAPAGVYAVGLAFLLRDTLQRLSGQLLALAGIACGTLLTWIVVDHALAFASATAFIASEVAGLAVFYLARGNTGGPKYLGLAIVAAGVTAAAVDSAVFLTLAPEKILGPDALHHFFQGQFVAKISVTVLAIPFVIAARRIPEPARA